MASTLMATITMSEATVKSLSGSGYILQAFQAVQTNDSLTMPTIWLTTMQYATNTTLTWTDQVKAYTSFTAIALGKTIVAGFAADIEPDQVLHIDSIAGTGTMKQDGVPDALGVENTAGKCFTTGVSATAMVQGRAQPFSPLCAAPLYGHDLKLIELSTRVLFVIGGSTAAAGTVEGHSQGPGVIVDFGAATAAQNELTYDVDIGWSWGDEACASSVPPNTDLTTILAIRSESLVAKAKSLVVKATGTPPIAASARL